MKAKKLPSDVKYIGKEFNDHNNLIIQHIKIIDTNFISLQLVGERIERVFKSKTYLYGCCWWSQSFTIFICKCSRKLVIKSGCQPRKEVIMTVDAYSV